MELQLSDTYIGDRLPRFQAAAACLGVGPKLRRAGRYCIIVGAFVVAALVAKHVPATSPVLWAYLAVLGFGIYLYLPDPRPWTLPVAGSIIIAVLAVGILAEYDLWRRFHTAPGGFGIEAIVEVLLAGALFGNYLSYKRNLSATDTDTLSELRGLAQRVNRADLEQDRQIVELKYRNKRARLRPINGFVLMISRHYIAFGRYSTLDAVAILKPEEITLAALETPKPGRPVRLRFSAPGTKPLVMQLKSQYLPRISGLGIRTSGMPTVQQESR